VPASVIEVQQLGLQLEHQLILQQLQFRVQRGDFIGIIGPNGAGKSSLLKLISGQLPVQQGQILLDGKPLAQYSARARAQKLAVVSQHDVSGFELTVSQLAAMGLLPHKSWFEPNHSVDEHQIALALEKVGLTDKSQQLLSRLSGGELQRALIAKALVQQPQI
jgi:iron complex transport system ATP-binding protein